MTDFGVRGSGSSRGSNQRDAALLEVGNVLIQRVQAAIRRARDTIQNASRNGYNGQLIVNINALIVNLQSITSAAYSSEAYSSEAVESAISQLNNSILQLLFLKLL